MDKQKIAIVDDNEINRMLLSSMLEDKYELFQASNGQEAIELIRKLHGGINLMLLDLVMPVMDGIELLKEMNSNKWIDDIPVIVISSETSPVITRRAYELGVDDFISRPFDPETVTKRIQKAIMLHTERRNLIEALAEEYKNRERQSAIMISILSNIVEQRNGESGIHVIHINIITALIIRALIKHTNQYGIREEDIPVVCNASSLHDVGKMGVPEAILNKPDKLTPAEFEIMKMHSMLGYEMMCKVDRFNNEPLLKYAKNICRSHHERWDGSGYPDGLSGDEIPIEAQVVSLADAYDALVSERCYKEAYSHEKAVEMILNGECGVFNPLLIECFNEVEESLKPLSLKNSDEFLNEISENLLSEQTISLISSIRSVDVTRNIRLLRSEEQRNDIFKMLTDEAWFEYYVNPEMVKFNPSAMKMFNLPEQVNNPFKDKLFLSKCGDGFRMDFLPNARSVTDVETFDRTVTLADGKKYRINGRVYFIDRGRDGSFGDYMPSVIGKITCLDS